MVTGILRGGWTTGLHVGSLDVVGDIRDTAQSCESVGQRVLGDGINAFYELQFGDHFQSQYVANYFEFDGVILGLVFT